VYASHSRRVARGLPGGGRGLAPRLDGPEPIGSGPNIAEGIACRLPLPWEDHLEVLRSSGGVAGTVSDQEIQGRPNVAGWCWYLRRTNGRHGGGAPFGFMLTAAHTG